LTLHALKSHTEPEKEIWSRLAFFTARLPLSFRPL
jgi:hypothetical protein